MIEKLDLLKMFNERQTDAQWNRLVEITVNLLIDAVNELQIKVNKLAPNIDFAQPEVKENVQDKFAEQRRWIGTLCKFWDGNKTATQTTDFAYGTLLEIDDYGDFKCDTMTWFDNCEPVKPDDPIIYKGGDNE